MNYKSHISFDLDGTLIDSFPLMKKSWENVNKELKINRTWEQYKENIGLPFDKICENLGISEFSEEIYKVYFEFNKKNIKYIKPMPGLKSCLNWLKQNEIEWSIITSKPSITALDICNYFDLKPNLLITSDMVKFGKPNIESSNILRTKLKNKKYYYIGDTIIDFIFAINSHFTFIEFINKNIDNELNYIDTILISNKRDKISSLDQLKNLII